jgi:hypothetical protein
VRHPASAAFNLQRRKGMLASVEVHVARTAIFGNFREISKDNPDFQVHRCELRF